MNFSEDTDASLGNVFDKIVDILVKVEQLVEILVEEYGLEQDEREARRERLQGLKDS